MFYSKDLLSKRSPLGAIWMVAHGKKLSKNKVMCISVQDICQEILHPDVPYSLRLQGILVGGVVVVFSKQQHYLLEDVQEMMRRVKDAISMAAGGQSKATLKQGKGKAKLADITLDDAGHDDLMMDRLDLNNALAQANNMSRIMHLQQGRPLGFTSADLTQMQEDDLFAVPAVSDMTQSGLTPTRSGTSLGGRQGLVRRNQNISGHHLMSTDDPNEMFALAGDDMHLDLAAELGEGVVSGPGEPTQEHLNDFADPQLQPLLARSGSHGTSRNGSAGGSTKRSKGGSTQHDRPSSEAEEPAGPGTYSDLHHPEDLDPREEDDVLQDQLLSDEQAKQESSDRAAAAAVLRSSYDAEDQEVLASEDEEGGVEKQQKNSKRKPAAAGTKRAPITKRKLKLITLAVDNPEHLLIKAKEFREWTLDTSSLVNKPVVGAKRMARDIAWSAQNDHSNPYDLSMLVTTGGLLPIKTGTVLPHQLAVAQQVGPLANLGRMRLCADLADMRDKRVAVSVEVHDEDDEGDIEGFGRNGKKGGKRTKVSKGVPAKPKATDTMPAGSASCGSMAAGANMVPVDDMGMLAMDEEMLLHDDEMHDMVHDLPFGGDVEVERLRAASITPNGSGLLPRGNGSDLGSGAAQLLAQGLMGSRGMSRGSGLPPGTTSSDGSEAHLRGIQLRGRLQSVDGSGVGSDLLLPGQSDRLMTCPSGAGRGTRSTSNPSGLLHWGTQTLEDLLPDMGLCDLTFRADTGSAGGSAPGANSLRAASSSDAALAPDSQRRDDLDLFFSGGEAGTLPLMETSAGDNDASQGLPQLSNKASTTTVRLFHQLLSQQKASGVPDPSVSFLGLAQRLTRSEAVKLFMQVLVTQTACYTQASQSEPFGDIMIKAGRRMCV